VLQVITISISSIALPIANESGITQTPIIGNLASVRFNHTLAGGYRCYKLTKFVHSSSMELIERISQSSQGAAQRLYVRSALNSMLWLTAVGSPICFAFAYLFRDFDFARNFLLIVGVLPILISCLGFCYLVITNPEKLQSEDFQIRQQTLEIIEQKTKRLSLDASALEAISRVATKQIESGERKL